MEALVYWAHVVATGVAGLVAVWLAVRIRRRFENPSAGWMWKLLVVIGAWAGTLTVQLLVPSPIAKRVLLGVGTLLGWASLALWVLFALAFTGRDHWLTRGVLGGLAAVYLLLAGLVVTEPIHGLLWTDVFLAEDGFTHLAARESTLQMAVFGVLFALAIVAFGLVLTSLVTARRASWRQLATVVGGFALTIPSALLEFTDLAPAPNYEYGPMLSILFFTSVAYGIYRHELFVVAPFPRDAVLECLAEGVVVVGTSGHIVDFNGRARKVLPALESGVGERFVSVVPDDMLADGGPADFPAGLDGAIERTVDDTRHRYTVDVTPLESNGRTRGYAVILRDRSELEAYAAKLERQSERLDQFAAVVSHDLRNPLSVARGQLELARETGDPESYEKLEDALVRMDDIIRDALTVARGEADPELAEPVSLQDAAADAWRQTDTRAATLENEVGDGEGFVLADRERLMTLFENLFRNSVDHGPDDVTVRVLVTEGGFAIEDTGPGIPEDEHERIFEHGYTTAKGNTGIGLSTVAEILGAYDWDVTVAGSPEGGARFEFET